MITSKLNKSAIERQSKNGYVFIVNMGKQEYDRQANSKIWVNYSAALYATEKQLQFYRDVLVQGAIIEVKGSGVLPRIWGDNNDKITLDIQNPTLGYTYQPGSPMPDNMKPQQQQPQQAPGGFDDFDDDIPF